MTDLFKALQAATAAWEADDMNFEKLYAMEAAASLKVQSETSLLDVN
jgi:hypothetical protein